MKLLQELVSFYKMNNEGGGGLSSGTDISDSQEQAVGPGSASDQKGIDVGAEDIDRLQGPEQNEIDPEEGQQLDALTNQATEDPDRQGLIRNVDSARLVYKRKNEEGTFEELWVYNVNNIKDGMEVRRVILAGTDIPTTKTRSPDGSQTFSLWNIGNVEMVFIKGLPQ